MRMMGEGAGCARYKIAIYRHENRIQPRFAQELFGSGGSCCSGGGGVNSVIKGDGRDRGLSMNRGRGISGGSGGDGGGGGGSSGRIKLHGATPS